MKIYFSNKGKILFAASAISAFVIIILTNASLFHFAWITVLIWLVLRGSVAFANYMENDDWTIKNDILTFRQKCKYLYDKSLSKANSGHFGTFEQLQLLINQYLIDHPQEKIECYNPKTDKFYFYVPSIGQWMSELDGVICLRKNGNSIEYFLFSSNREFYKYKKWCKNIFKNKENIKKEIKQQCINDLKKRIKTESSSGY